MAWLAAAALLAWLYLIALHGRFWSAGPVLAPSAPCATPPVAVIVPARDEAEVIGPAIASLLAQDYRGQFGVTLVDDGSADGTAEVAREASAGRALGVLTAPPRPPGWAGKLWAVEQGVAATGAAWLLLTDADIVHEPAHLSTLIAQAERSGADLVSEMVALRREDRAERALIPAFVYLFQMLYPFAWVRDPNRATAAAAGGTVLVRRTALIRAGGIAAIAGRLIDDVALASRVKASGGRIWLGHATLARSIRRYPRAAHIWRMIARSAYVQLRCSPILLAATVAGLVLIFLVPPVAALAGRGIARLLGLAAWALMAASFAPTLLRFGGSLAWAPLLPAIVLFYVAATIGSAVDHHRGRGVVWKQRAYAERRA